MLNLVNKRIKQRIIYHAIVKKGINSTEARVPEVNIDIETSLSVNDTMLILASLVRTKVRKLYRSGGEIPSPRLLHRYEISEIYEHGEELVSVEVDVSCIVKNKNRTGR